MRHPTHADEVIEGTTVSMGDFPPVVVWFRNDLHLSEPIIDHKQGRERALAAYAKACAK